LRCRVQSAELFLLRLALRLGLFLTLLLLGHLRLFGLGRNLRRLLWRHDAFPFLSSCQSATSRLSRCIRDSQLPRPWETHQANSMENMVSRMAGGESEPLKSSRDQCPCRPCTYLASLTRSSSRRSATGRPSTV